jgi:hypothetical protein
MRPADAEKPRSIFASPGKLTIRERCGMGRMRGRPLAKVLAVPAVGYSGKGIIRPWWSFFRHCSLAQPGQISGFEQGTDLRHPEISSFQAGKARITPVAVQPLGFYKFGGSALRLVLEAIRTGEESVRVRRFRIGAARFLEPSDRLVDARLQQVC